jgi:hypothetical protein
MIHPGVEEFHSKMKEANEFISDNLQDLCIELAAKSRGESLKEDSKLKQVYSMVRHVLATPALTLDAIIHERAVEYIAQLPKVSLN